MNVCFDVSAALTQGAGVSRYIRELLAAMIEIDDAPNITLFNNHRPNQNLDLLPTRARALLRIEAPMSDKVWRLRLLAGAEFPQLASFNKRFDLFHGTDVIAPRVPAPIVVTVHDMTTWLFPQYHTRANRWYQRLTLPMFMRRATQIITDSHSTRDDLVRLTGTPADKITVVHLGVDHSKFNPRPITEARQRIASQLNITQPFFLAVGTIEPRKNLSALMQAFDQSGLSREGFKLVLTGMRGWNSDALLQSLKLDSGIASAVMLAGYVPDDLLPNLYSAAIGFVYPSIYEGFGLPVLEAMACGAPVITSNTSSLPEVSGDAAVLIAPTDIDAIAGAMRTLAFEPEHTATRRALSTRQAAQFTWRKTAQSTLNVYRQALHTYGNPNA